MTTSALPYFATDHDDVIEPFTADVIRYWNETHHTEFDWRQLPSTTYHLFVGCDQADMDRAIHELMERRLDPANWTAPDPATVASLNEIARYRRIIVLTARIPAQQELTERYYERYLPGIVSDVEPVGAGLRGINLVGNPYYGGPFERKQEFLARIGAAELADDSPCNLEGADRYGFEGILYGTYPWGDAFDLEANGCWRAIGGWPQIADYIRCKSEAATRMLITS